ncbi:MAG: LPS translocon maturation chaperone LptM [Myxococcaceae bacterium]
MRFWLAAAVLLSALGACGIKGPPKPPTVAVAPPPPQSQSQTPMNQGELVPDAGCSTCREGAR